MRIAWLGRSAGVSPFLRSDADGPLPNKPLKLTAEPGAATTFGVSQGSPGWVAHGRLDAGRSLAANRWAAERAISKYNTNLAAEFFVLSMLHRLGFDATITLGNKKSVDIVVTLRTGHAVTIDVKGLAGTTGWPVDNLKRGSQGHFIVFVCFRGRIDDPLVSPEVYVVPSTSVRRLIYNAPGGRKLVRLSTLKGKGGKFQDAWHLLRRSTA